MKDSTFGDPAAALHFEDLAALAFVVAMVTGFGLAAIETRGPRSERIVIAVGIVTFVAVPLWITMVVCR